MDSKGQDMIQIQFLDKNVVGALAPAFSMKPERIVFLYDTRVVSENAMREMKEALVARLPRVQVQYERTNMLSLDEIKASLEKVIKTYEHKDIQIDITGGSEIMTACGLMLAKEHVLVPTFVDFYSKQVRLSVYTERFFGQRLCENYRRGPIPFCFGSG